MSITLSLLLLLLCFSFHACNARSFGVVHNETQKKFQHSVIIKKNEKLNETRVFIQPDTRSSKPYAIESRFEKEKISSESNKPGKHNQVKDNPVVGPGATQTDHKSLASVSWKVPQKKRGEQEPGFNLDYLPPKTHPPVHN